MENIEFTRKNGVLLGGLVLPLLCCICFGSLKYLTQAKKPKHDILIVANHYKQSAVNYDFIEHGDKISIQAKTTSQVLWHKPQMMVYSVEDNSIRELPCEIEFTNLRKPKKINDIKTYDISNYKINTEQLSPDGYQFISQKDIQKAGILTRIVNSIFSYKGDLFLINGYSILPLNSKEQIIRDYNTKFFGWVINEKRNSTK